MQIRRLFLRRLRKDTRGQAIVELAIMMPVFLLMVLGMIDLARAWNAKQVITDAAREAVRTGVVGAGQGAGVTQAQLEGIAETAIGNAGFDPVPAVFDWTGGIIDGAAGTQLQLLLTYPYDFQFMSIFMDMVGGSTIQLQSRIIMRNE